MKRSEKTFLFAHVALSVLLTGCREQQSALTAQHVISAAACDKPIVIGERHFAETGATVLVSACRSGSPTHPVMESIFTDLASGRLVDMAAIEKAEEALLAARDKIEPRLQTLLDKASEHDVFDVDVWLAHDSPSGFSNEALKSPEYTTAYRAALSSAVGQFHRDLRMQGSNASLVSHRELEGQPQESDDAIFPFVVLKATASEIKAIEKVAGVTSVMLSITSPIDETEGHSEAYYDLARAPMYQDNWGHNASGMVIADAYNGRPASTHNLSMAPGICVPPSGGANYLCHCPTASFGVGDHLLGTLGIMRNSQPTGLRGGLARGATIISANWDLNVSGTGSCTYTGATAWALTNQAAAINHSFGFLSTTRTGQSSREKFDDFTTNQDPWPVLVFSCGNAGATATVSNMVHNGLVVGGVKDSGSTDRGVVGYSLYTHNTKNPLNSPTWELPHIVAPAEQVDTAGISPNTIQTRTGTSFAAPQVTALAGVIKSLNSGALRLWPYATMAAILVGPELGDNYPLYDSDPDAKAGVGLMNGKISIQAGSIRRQPNATFSPTGHDFGFISNADASKGPYIVSVGPGQVIRAAGWVATQPSCSNPPADNNCSSGSLPRFSVVIVEPGIGGSTFATGARTQQSYQYAAYVNSAPFTRTFEVWLMRTGNIPGSGAEFGVAWSSLMN